MADGHRLATASVFGKLAYINPYGIRLTRWQCAAALYQVVPESSIFRLPALAHDDVRLWMKTEFSTQLTVLEANAGDPVSTERLQNALLRQSLQHVVVTLQQQSREVAQLRSIVHRRTAALSPPTLSVSCFEGLGYSQGAILASGALSDMTCLWSLILVIFRF